MSATDRLVSDLKHVVQSSEELLHATKDAVGDKALAVRERLTDALDDAPARAAIWKRRLSTARRLPTKPSANIPINPSVSRLVLVSSSVCL